MMFMAVMFLQTISCSCPLDRRDDRGLPTVLALKPHPAGVEWTLMRYPYRTSKRTESRYTGPLATSGGLDRCVVEFDYPEIRAQ
jgi:hypothetical protein